MAFVFDPNDPNGQGMFSKAGRVTSAKYVVFQKRAEILNNERKLLRVSSLPLFAVDPQPKVNTLPTFQEEQETKPKNSTNTRKKVEVMPFSKQISREIVEKAKGRRGHPPPAGFYNPKFNFVESYSREKPRPRSSIRLREPFDEEEASKPVPDKPIKKIVGPTLFHHQTARERFFKPTNNPHEDRFLYLGLPNTFSKTKRVGSIDLGKYSARQSRWSRGAAQGDYNPNFEIVKKRLGKSGPGFHQLTARKSMVNITWCTNESFYNVNKTINLKYARPKQTDFGKDLPRDWNDQSPLPCFLQKGNNSRLSLDMMNQKALESNGFGDGGFYDVPMDFSPNQTNRTKICETSERPSGMID